jgi:hypothetical protein
MFVVEECAKIHHTRKSVVKMIGVRELRVIRREIVMVTNKNIEAKSIVVER